MNHDWVSARAVAWVIHDAPVPADLAFTLTVIAARCDEHGRGSYQSISTIATKVGKSPKQAQRDVVRLRELGLLLLGDPGLVEHLPPGQRPVVYDVPMHLSGPKPVKESRNKSGVKKVIQETPPMDGTSPSGGTPPVQAPSTPPMDDLGPLPSKGAKQPLNNPLNNPSLVAAARTIVDAFAEKKIGITEEEAREIISLMETDARRKNDPIVSLAPFVRAVARNGDLPGFLARVRAGERAAVPRETPIPPPASAVLAQRRTSATPPEERDEELTDREKAIAHARGRIGHSTPNARLAIPEQAEPAEAAEARAELARYGDFGQWMTAAYGKLGGDAHRDEVVILAANLARTHRAPVQESA
ncbi:hypothetical protein [Streptosporangium jomthongense]|uniref:Helix-turn-helix domain-containing protein n=1 Tax=Streptosporangium jomthongense TaxID=1193683 RepID=A0ABV8ETN3_9ACTN